MKWLLLVIALLALLALVVVVVGVLLPKAHRASAQVIVGARPEVVYAILVDFASGPTWRTGIKKVELLVPRDGKPSFKEWGDNGEMTYVVEESIPPRRLVTRIVDQSAFGGTWTFELTPQGDATAVEITERGEVYNPLFRFMATFFFSPTATLERYLSDLKKRASNAS
jgi:hypothetical protein